jgi:hypothetical protein
MGKAMKTTIELPDELFKSAKLKALEDGITLKELFIDALTQKIQSPVKLQSNDMPWKSLKGTATVVPHLEHVSGFDEESDFLFVNEVKTNVTI